MLTVAAPGKVMLFGEYGVLHGGPALVVAVEPSAHCIWHQAGSGMVSSTYGVHDPASPEDTALPFVRALFDRLGAPDRGQFVLEAGDFGVMMPAGWQKFGLGSSAATTVALCACVLQVRGAPAGPERLFALAHAAHRSVQGGGSGADIAASAFGGALSYRWIEGDDTGVGLLVPGHGRATVEALPAEGRSILMAWTGRPASTPELIAAFEALRGASADRAAALVARIGDAARLGVAAWRSDDAEALAAAAASGRLAVERLGDAMGRPLLIRAHRILMSVAGPFGAEVKPTGAGGGDLAWIVERDPHRRADLRAAVEDAGFRTFEYRISPPVAER